MSVDRARLDAALALAAADPDAILAVVGPTASGKTALAIALAEALGGEIVSADSVQIYRSFDLGSGKPTAEELARARHHLVGALDPMDPIDAARFAELAGGAVEDIRARGLRPIVCGGTFLWVKALLYGLAEGPPADAAIRARHKEVVATEGREALHRMLAAVDPASADRLHFNDIVRVSRSLEVHELTGRSQTDHHAGHGFRTPRWPSVLMGIRFTPEELTVRIRARVEGWIGGGWEAEVRRLRDGGYREARAMASVGYREMLAFVEGELPEAELVDSIVRATRIFARRQRTWLGREPINWL